MHERRYGPARQRREPGAPPVLEALEARLLLDASLLPGDADANGHVNVFDLAVLANHYGRTSGCAWGDGDFDGNGAVDVLDLAAMANHYDASAVTTLVVNGGGGDGAYDPGEVVPISADAPPTGFVFYGWSGDTAGIADLHAADTTLTVPAIDAAITANFSPELISTDQFRESPATAYVEVAVDDSQLAMAVAAPNGDGTNLTLRNLGSGEYNLSVLLAVKDLFDYIPASRDGRDVQILSAELHLFRYNQGTSADTAYVHRVTTDWLADPAGTNESDVSHTYREVSTTTGWSAGAFGSGDYDAAADSGAWSDSYNEEIVLDATACLQGIYASGDNYGLLLRTAGTAPLNFRSSENGADLRPFLAVTYSYGQATPMHELTVTDGSGGGMRWEGEAVPIVADAPRAGEAFNMWVGNVGTTDGHTSLDWDDQLLPSTTYVMGTRDAEVLATYRDASAPLDWYPRWDYLSRSHFGTEAEPLAYEIFGDVLAFQADGLYEYASETSAFVAFETNLPATTAIEYGVDTSYGSRVEQVDRYTYLHQAYLTGLPADTTLHYRFVATDERGNSIASADYTLTTATPAGVIYLPGGHLTTAYTLDQNGATYLVTGDIVADYAAFEIPTGVTVTLDLGGHTVVYNDVDDQYAGTSYSQEAPAGVRAWAANWVGLYNGVIRQGRGYNSANESGLGYAPVNVRSTPGGEVAGITAEYAGTQVAGFWLHYSPNVVVHHNTVLDRGGEMINRHQGTHGIGGAEVVHHNLMLRVRNRGISGVGDSHYYDNEIYVDSVCTNSFGVMFYNQTGSEVEGNRIFGGGYLTIGVGPVSGSADIDMHDNFIHLRSGEPDNRWPEYGAMSGVNGFRQTWGGADLSFHDNVVSCTAADGGYARALWVYQDDATQRITFDDNVLKTTFLNGDSTEHGSIVVTGNGNPAAQPMVFTDNRVISNLCNVYLGMSYGQGSNTIYHGNTFVREGPDRGDYRTINIGYGGGTTTGHQFFDSTFEGGASYDSFNFDGSGVRDFTVGWTLTIDTEIGATVTIRDAHDAVVFTGVVDATGQVSAPLLEYTRNPAGQTFHTAHEVTVEKTGFTPQIVDVLMDAKKVLDIPLV